MSQHAYRYASLLVFPRMITVLASVGTVLLVGCGPVPPSAPESSAERQEVAALQQQQRVVELELQTTAEQLAQLMALRQGGIATSPNPGPSTPTPEPTAAPSPLSANLPGPIPSAAPAASVDATMVEKSGNYAVVRVFYGTDRNVTGQAQPSEFYGNFRGEQLSLGACEVSVPHTHRVGEIERPSWVRLEFREDPSKHIVLLSVDPMQPDDYYTHLKRYADRFPPEDGEVFVFIHGFNVTFEQAAQRTAQMAYDLNFTGAAVMFS